MPIYQYRCRDCGKVSEVLVTAISATTDPACSNCGSRSLDKLISAPSLVRTGTPSSGRTCCGREERCDSPACATGDQCWRR